VGLAVPLAVTRPEAMSKFLGAVHHHQSQLPRGSVRRGAGAGFPGAVGHHQDQFAGGDRAEAVVKGTVDGQPDAARTGRTARRTAFGSAEEKRRINLARAGQ
jgi:hypothetical protein